MPTTPARRPGAILRRLYTCPSRSSLISIPGAEENLGEIFDSNSEEKESKYLFDFAKAVEDYAFERM